MLNAIANRVIHNDKHHTTRNGLLDRDFAQNEHKSWKIKNNVCGEPKFMTSSPRSSEAIAPKRLNFLTKLAFGAGDMGTGMTANLVAFSFLAFLTNVAGLSPGKASLILVIGKIWDAINDPLVGFLSDRTRSRWGRRHIWMLMGSIPFGISFGLLWFVPGSGISENLKFAYYLVVSIIFFTTYTTVNLPYAAMTPELTQDYDERTTLNSFRLAFSLTGAILGLVLGAVMAQLIPDDPRQQFFVLGVTCGVISILPLYLCIWGTRSHVKTGEAALQIEDDSDANLTVKQQFKILLNNRPYLFVIGIYLTSWLALQITATIIPFFVVNWMQLDSFFLVALAVQGAAIPLLFVCSAISQKLGKRGLYGLGMVAWILIQSSLFFLQPGQTTLLYALALAASFGVATAYVVPWSMLPDVIELDELRTGQRREGVFYSFMTLLQKLGLALGIFLVGQALEFAGFVSATPGEAPPPQPESALLAIRIAIGPLPTICLIIGLVLVYFYPLTRHVHADILLKLNERKRQAALDKEQEAN